MKQRAEGLTVIEFVIAVAMVGILAAVSLPLFLPAIRTSRVDGAAGQVIAVLRSAQSMAVGQGNCFGFRSGNDPSVGRPNQYRIERGGCDGSTPAWPAATDTKAGNTRVITDWTNIGSEYSGVNLG